VFCEYDRREKKLTISHNYGDVELGEKYVPALKFLMERAVIAGVRMERPFALRGFTLYPDGTLKVAGYWVGKEQVKVFLGGREVSVPALSMKLWRVLD
jgi:hypothetical protein